MTRSLALASLLLLGGCAALPVAAWTAIGAGFGACAAACAPVVNLETEAFRYFVEGEKHEDQAPAPAK